MTRNTDNREDSQNDPNSCFRDLSDSLNSLSSLNILLNLGKTLMPRAGVSERAGWLERQCNDYLLFVFGQYNLNQPQLRI